jgi:hypothetical protein
MDDLIGFLELVAWAICVVALAAAVTFAVVKLFPGSDEKAAKDEGSPAAPRS